MHSRESVKLLIPIPKGRCVLAEDATVNKTDIPKSEEYQRFETLARGLFAVPKAELDAQIKKMAEAKDNSKTK